MQDLLTDVMLEVIPFLKQRDIDIITAFMIVDVKITQSIPQKIEKEGLTQYITALKTLNNILNNFFTLESREKRIFDNSKIDILVESPKYLYNSSKGKGFISKRLDVYSKYRPDVFEILNSINLPK